MKKIWTNELIKGLLDLANETTIRQAMEHYGLGNTGQFYQLKGRYEKATQLDYDLSRARQNRKLKVVGETKAMTDNQPPKPPEAPASHVSLVPPNDDARKFHPKDKQIADLKAELADAMNQIAALRDENQRLRKQAPNADELKATIGDLYLKLLAKGDSK